MKSKRIQQEHRGSLVHKPVCSTLYALADLITERMLKTNLVIAWRNILKYRMLSIINICGLAIGITTCIVIILFVADEYSYDRYHENSDRIYRVILKGWLQDFTYRIDIPWWVLLVAALSTLLMALVTMSLKSIKAALANPVEALRNK